MKKFWDQNYGGHPYDPVARRRGAPTDTPATIAPLGPPKGTGGYGAGLGAAHGNRAGGGRTPIGGPRSASAASNETVKHLEGQLREMSTHLEGLEKERDFYFAKLRDIEILVQQQMEVLTEKNEEDATLSAIQQILYSTEEGFEVPEGGGVDEEETF